MCKGNCKECKRLQIPCRTINERLTVYCFECGRFGIQADHIAEIHPAVLEEIADAKEHLKRMGKVWAVEWHGKAITAEAERQEAKRGVTVDKATFSGVTRITKEQWNAIPDDYKGRWKKGNWNVPEEWIGKRTVLEGCLPGGHGTALVTEGIHFEIVK